MPYDPDITTAEFKVKIGVAENEMPNADAIKEALLEYFGPDMLYIVTQIKS